MALNPNISLQVQPPQFAAPQIASPLEQYQKVLTLRNLMAQGQLGQLNLEQTRLENQALQRTAADEQAARQLLSRPDAPTEPEIYGTLGPKAGSAFLKAKADAEESRLKAMAERAGGMASRAGTILANPDVFVPTIMQAQADGFLTPAQAREILKGGYNEGQIRQFADQALTRKQQIDAALDQAKATREAAESEARLPGLRAKSLEEQLGVAAQTAPNNQAEWDAWRAGLSPELQARTPAMFSPAARQQVQMMGVKPAAPVPGRDVPYTPDVFQQQRELRIAGAPVVGRDIPLPEPVVRQQLEVEKEKAKIRGEGPQKPLSGEAAKVFSITQTMQPEIDRLRRAFQDDYKGAVYGIISGTNRELSRLANNVADKVGRLRSGGAINKDEARNFMGQIASWKDLLAGDSASALQALDALGLEAATVANEIRPQKTQGEESVAPRPSAGTADIVPSGGIEPRTGLPNQQVVPTVPSGAPPVGTIREGRSGRYRYRGGDPNAKENWQLVK